MVMTMRSRQDILLPVIVTAGVTFALTAAWFSRSHSRFPEEERDFEAGQGKPLSSDESHAPFYHERLALSLIRKRSQRMLRLAQKRRTLRFFAPDHVPKDVIFNILQTACTAPSGAHRQPWTFVAISSPELKQMIRALVEHEESINYQRRMKKTWVNDVQGMVSQVHKTENVEKPYLTEAPWIVTVFKQTHSFNEDGERLENYYVQESVGLACGIMCMAIQNANLVTLTSTPMGAEKGIREVLGRPENEKVFLLMPIGFPAENSTVPFRDPERKPSSETIIFKT